MRESRNRSPSRIGGTTYLVELPQNRFGPLQALTLYLGIHPGKTST